MVYVKCVVIGLFMLLAIIRIYAHNNIQIRFYMAWYSVKSAEAIIVYHVKKNIN